MFKKFHGFHLLESHYKMRLEQVNAQRKKILTNTAIKAAVVILMTLLIWNLPSDSFGIEGLTIVQQRIIAIFAFATLAWVLEVVPAWATSVAVIGLLLIFTSDSGLVFLCRPEEVGTLLSYKSVMATFADPVIMLFIGGFILAIAAGKTGIDAYLAKVLLRPFGNKSENVLLGFLLITGLFSMFVSNTATAAMMLTFLAPVFKQLPPEGKGRMGMGTPIGTPPNTIALKYLNDPEGLNLGIGFGEWMMFMLPLVIVLLFISWIIIKKLYPFTQKTINLQIEGELQKDARTKIVIVTFILTVILWLLDSVSGINSYTVALVPFVIFSVTGVIDRRDLEEVNWSVIWMVAGGFALGYALNASGLAKQAVSSIPFGEFSPLAILILAGLICYGLSNFISNSATAALLMPILTVVCMAMGDKLNIIGGTSTVLISVAVAASSAMVLPISTPPNALAFATNLISQKDMARIGLIIGILSMVMGGTLLYVLGTMHII